MSMTMTYQDLDLSPPGLVVQSCPDCPTPAKRKRRPIGVLKYPENVRHEPLSLLFARHPWLEEHRLGALPVALRDAVVSNA